MPDSLPLILRVFGQVDEKLARREDGMGVPNSSFVYLSFAELSKLKILV